MDEELECLPESEVVWTDKQGTKFTLEEISIRYAKRIVAYCYANKKYVPECIVYKAEK